MKKLVILVILIISGFMINMVVVNAEGSNYNGSYRDDSNIMKQQSYADCGVLGNPKDSNTFAFYLQTVFDIIRFLGPVLVLVMTIIDLVKVTAEQKQDGEIQKIGVKTLKRFIYAVLIFALPTLITSIFHLIGLYGTCVS